MNSAVIVAACNTVLALVFLLLEADGLAEGHARVRTQILNASRWAIVAALSWVLIPAAISEPGPQRVMTIVGMAGLIGAVMLIPVRWFVRLGGREPKFELRQTKVEITRLANKARRAPGSVPSVRMREAADRIEALRTSEASELCDLLLAQIGDLQAGSEGWNEAGRRSVRIDDLCRRIWPDDMPPPDYDPDEATFRWHLYRLFGRMMEIGRFDNPSVGQREKFRALALSLEEFRRDDTYRFIDAVYQSADRWLAHPVGRPWIGSFDFEALGPDGLAEIRKIWGRDAAMWGADLDDEDRRAIKEDLARRAAPPEPADEKPAEPADGLTLGPAPEPTAAE